MPEFLKFVTIAGVVFALLSTVFWGFSSRVNFSFGYDMDRELDLAMRRASRLNALGALFASLSAICQALVLWGGK
ncbi:hypothetical protein J2W34_006329 [Variovorax boronicumulans]|uniref:hypothetical protein n=1 Tax=Variovorax boronicumulans TaxID=436515 RepID=UPI00277ED369|nr:hypothetical protein [Variovorax boronicumulans]MDQ0074505.1 hypothetical protein [Variovorax boronicumulans]